MARARKADRLAPLVDVLALLSEHGRMTDAECARFLAAAEDSSNVTEATMLALDHAAYPYLRPWVLECLGALERGEAYPPQPMDLEASA